MIKPILDRVIVVPEKAKTETEAGIHLVAVERPNVGTIVAKGEGVYAIQTGVLIPTTVKVGDKVLYSSYAGNELEIEGEVHLIMKESDIFAVI